MTSCDNPPGTATRGPQRVTGRPGWDQHPGVRTGQRLRLGEHGADVVSRATGSWIYLIVITTAAVVAAVVAALPGDRGALAGVAVGLSALALIEVAVVLMVARRAERIVNELALYHLDQARRATAIAEDLRAEMGRLQADLARIAAHTDIAGHPARRGDAMPHSPADTSAGRSYAGRMRVLIVEDDPAMAAVLGRGLQRAGHAVDTVGTGTDAVWAILETDFDVVVLDAMIPAPDGFEVCRRIRAKGRWVPVLMLTARDGTLDKVRGLDAGADDYLTKPFALDELLARVRALIRREPMQRPTELRVRDLVLDPAGRTVHRGDTLIALSAKEFALLQELMRRAGETLTRTYLIEHVWDFAYDGGSNVVDVYVRYLRDKVDRPFGRETIRTVRGAGYRLDPDA